MILDVAPNSSDFVTVTVALIAGVVSLGTAYMTLKLRQVHVLVNSKMDTALKRIQELEKKLGLEEGEIIPSAPIVTESTAGIPPANHPE